MLLCNMLLNDFPNVDNKTAVQARVTVTRHDTQSQLK